MKTTLEFVEFYISQGFAVFPCQNKKPLTKNGFKDAVKDLEKAKSLFAPYPDAQIGIATGKISGFFVLDVDVKNEAGGEESLKQLIKENGTLPETVESITQSGGRHIWYKYQDGIGCKTRFRPGLDIRGDGGYIVAPGSKNYHFEVNHDLTDGYKIASSFNWLVSTFATPKMQTGVNLSNDPIPSGARNTELTRVAGKYRSEGYSETDIYNKLVIDNQKRCTPPLPDYELRNISKSISSYARRPVMEKFTDLWAGNMFASFFGTDIKWCPELGGWMMWEDTHWALDSTSKIKRLQSEAINRIKQIAEKEDNALMRRYVTTLEAEARLNSMVSIAKKDTSVPSSTFDKDIYLLNLNNGTYNLETGELKPHDRDHFITRKISLNYNREAECPIWTKFLYSTFGGNQDVIKFMQKAIGYSLSGNTSEQCIFILYGTGSNGKSTFLKHIYKIMGEYASNAPTSTIMNQYGNAIPNDIARLRGRRFVTIFESDKGQKLSESKIKQFTGDDPISARFLNKEYFDFIATFKIFCATNNKPEISGTDKGIWRRIKAIPFRHTVTDEAKDKFLDTKLKLEYEGMLNWAIEGFALWQSEGLGKVEEIETFTKEYQKDSDTLGNFLTDKCSIHEDFRVNATEIFKEMNAWCKDNNYRPIKLHTFRDYMISRGFKQERKTAGEGRGKIYWLGVELNPEGAELEYESVPF